MKITIPQWMKDELPINAGFCELVNMALDENPNMTLAEFAKSLDELNKEETLERVINAELEQLGGMLQ